MAEESSAAKAFIKTSKEKVSGSQILWEFVRTSVEVLFITLGAIIRFFLPVRKSLEGEIVLITGAAGYVGRRLALRFARKGEKGQLSDFNLNYMA